MRVSRTVSACCSGGKLPNCNAMSGSANANNSSAHGGQRRQRAQHDVKKCARGIFAIAFQRAAVEGNESHRKRRRGQNVIQQIGKLKGGVVGVRLRPRPTCAASAISRNRPSALDSSWLPPSSSAAKPMRRAACEISAPLALQRSGPRREGKLLA